MFVSSHLLSEVEQTCDRVAIIDRGRLVLSGRVDDVLAEAARPSLIVGLDDTVGGADILGGPASSSRKPATCCGWRCPVPRRPM